MASVLFTPSVVEKVSSLLQKGSAGSVVSVWEEIVEVMLQAGVAWRAQIPPEFVGTHPQNRSKLGVGGSESHHHGYKVLQAGWSWRKCSDATCIEHDPADKEAVQDNEDFVALSGGYIPPLSQLKYLSIGGGHTNTFLRAVKAGCPSAVDKLADSTGKLNQAELVVGRDSFKEATESGLKWLVLHKGCTAVWPSLILFAQSALNTHANSQQNEIEVMLDMHGKMAAALRRGNQPDWKSIKEAAAFSLPPCADYIDSLAAYVKDYSGGPEGDLLQDLSMFFKAFACKSAAGSADRRLGSEFMSRLTTMSFGPAEKFPLLLNGCIKLQLMSPANKIADGLCKLVAPSNLNSLTAKAVREEIRKAEKLLLDCRVLCTGMGVPANDAVKCIGKLDVRVLAHLLKKAKEIEEKPLLSLNAVAEAIRPVFRDIAWVLCCSKHSHNNVANTILKGIFG